MDGLADEFLARLAPRADALLAQHVAQVVLRRGPLLGKLRFGVDRSGLAIGGHRFA